MAHLPLDDRAEPRRKLVVAGVGEPQNFDGAEDRRQRVPELVREHRQEFVLLTIGRLELLERALPLVLGEPAFGDILTGAEQSDGAAACVLFDVGPGVNPPDDSIGPNDPVILFESFAARDPGLCRRQHRLAILRVDGVDEALVVDRDAGGPAEQPVGLVRPPQRGGPLLAVELRLPAPHVGSDLRLGEHVLAAAPGAFRVLDLADVGDQHDQAVDATTRISVRHISRVHVARRAELIEGAVVEYDRLAGQRPRDAMPNLLPGRLSQHLTYMAATDLLRCQAEPAPVRFIDPDVTGVGVDERQQRRYRVGHELELPLALAERVGLPRRPGHVMQDVDRAAVRQRAPGFFDRAQRAVRSEQPGSIWKHISARLWRRRPIAFERLGMDEAHQRPSQADLARVSEQVDRRAVQLEDAASAVSHHDGDR